MNISGTWVVQGHWEATLEYRWAGKALLGAQVPEAGEGVIPALRALCVILSWPASL